MAFHSINAERRLYNLSHGTGKDAGFTCLGFDIAEKWLVGVLAWMPANKRPVVCDGEAEIGTEGRYAFFARVMDAAAKHATETKTRCPVNLIPQLIGLEGKRVEVTTPDGERSRFYVSKSNGLAPDSSGARAHQFVRRRSGLFPGRRNRPRHWLEVETRHIGASSGIAGPDDDYQQSLPVWRGRH